MASGIHALHWRSRNEDDVAVCGKTRDRGFMRSTADPSLASQVNCANCLRSKVYLAARMEAALAQSMSTTPTNLNPEVDWMTYLEEEEESSDA